MEHSKTKRINEHRLTECKNKSLSIKLYVHNEDLSKTWVMCFDGNLKKLSFLYPSEWCTVKMLLELAGMVVTNDVLSAKVFNLPETQHFKIRTQVYDSNNIADRLGCLCTNPRIEVNVNMPRVKRPFDYVLPSDYKTDHFVRCLACNQESFNHASCDYCFYVYKEKVKSISIHKKYSDDKTKNPTPTIRTYTVLDIVREFDTYESQITLRQKQQEKSSQLKLRILETKEELIKLWKRVEELQEENLKMYKVRR